MWMQLTYCCDTFKLVRVGCTIGSILRPNQIKSRSSMFLLLCLGLRPHWCILRKWHFTAFQLDLLYPVCILYILCSYARSAIFFLPQRRLCFCYSGVWNMQQSESLQEFISKPGRIMILEQTWPCGLQLSWKMRASIQSPRDCARLNSWPESIWVFSDFLQCPGALVSPWFRDKGRGPHPGHLVSKSMCWVLKNVEVRNPDLKSSHNFAWFVRPRSVPVAWGSFFVCVMWAGSMWKMEEHPVCGFPPRNDTSNLGLNPLTGRWLGNLLSMAAAEQMLCILSSQRLGGNYVANMTCCGPLRCIGQPRLTMPIYTNYTPSLIGPSRLKGRLFSHVFSELLLNIGTFSGHPRHHSGYLDQLRSS